MNSGLKSTMPSKRLRRYCSSVPTSSRCTLNPFRRASLSTELVAIEVTCLKSRNFTHGGLWSTVLMIIHWLIRKQEGLPRVGGRSKLHTRLTKNPQPTMQARLASMNPTLYRSYAHLRKKQKAELKKDYERTRVIGPNVGETSANSSANMQIGTQQRTRKNTDWSWLERSSKMSTLQRRSSSGPVAGNLLLFQTTTSFVSSKMSLLQKKRQPQVRRRVIMPTIEETISKPTKLRAKGSRVSRRQTCTSDSPKVLNNR